MSYSQQELRLNTKLSQLNVFPNPLKKLGVVVSKLSLKTNNTTMSGDSKLDMRMVELYECAEELDEEAVALDVWAAELDEKLVTLSQKAAFLEAEAKNLNGLEQALKEYRRSQGHFSSNSLM